MLTSTVDLLQIFSDATRLRLLALLASEELTVAELTQITELPQPRVSTHLGKLRQAGLTRDRKRGASTFYALNDGSMPAPARKVWEALRTETDDAVFRADRKRCAALVSARRSKTPWLDSVAGEMERHYSPGRTWEATAHGLLGLLRLGHVLDLGAGDGTLGDLLARRALSYTLVDESERMIAAARRRLASHENVRFVCADMCELGLDRKTLGRTTFDEVVLFHSLTYVADPARALANAARVLATSGRLVAVTLHRHSHEELARTYNHVHLGFQAEELAAWLARTGLVVESCEVTSRERRRPYFEVLTAVARPGSSRNGVPR